MQTAYVNMIVLIKMKICKYANVRGVCVHMHVLHVNKYANVCSNSAYVNLWTHANMNINN